MGHWLERVIALLRAETADLRELARLADGDPRTFYVGTKLDGADVRGQDLRGMQFTDLEHTKLRYDQTTLVDNDVKLPSVTTLYDDMARRISSFGRQETRISLLMLEVLESPNNSLLILASYKPRAKFEREITELLINRLTPIWGQETEAHYYEDEPYLDPAFDAPNFATLVSSAVCDAVRFALRRAFPERRGIQLLEFARFLGKYPEIRTILTRRLARSNSMYVNEWRDEIAAILHPEP